MRSVRRLGFLMITIEKKLCSCVSMCVVYIYVCYCVLLVDREPMYVRGVCSSKEEYNRLGDGVI